MIAFALVAAVIVQTISFAAILRWLTRQHFRERDLLQNKLMSAFDKPWQEAPARAERPKPVGPSSLVRSVEQLP